MKFDRTGLGMTVSLSTKTGLRPVLVVWLCLAACVCFSTGCGSEPSATGDGNDAGPSGACKLDTDCPSGQGCKAAACEPVVRNCIADPCPAAPCQSVVCDRFSGCTSTSLDAGVPCGKDACATACTASGTCAPRTSAIVCPNPGVCKKSVCNPANAACETKTVANGTGCDDGDACTATDVCSNAGCSGKKIDCDDDNVCTQDGCASKGGCTHTPVDGACDDGMACTPEDLCSAGKCVGKGAASFSDAYGSSSDEEAYAVVASKTGLVLVGWTETLGGNIRGWMARIAAGGKMTTQQSYGKGTFDLLTGATARAGGGVIAVGVTDRNGDDDGWLLITDDTGAAVIDVAVKGQGSDSFEAVLQSKTGAIAVGATGKKSATTDGWIVSLDGSGAVTWQRSWGTAGKDRVRALVGTGKGFVVVGESTDPQKASEGAQTWVVKVGAAGGLIWQVTHGRPGDDFAAGVVMLPSGHVLVAGEATVKKAGSAMKVARLLRLDTAGKLVWERLFASHKSRFTSIAWSDGMAAIVGDRTDPASKVVRAWLIRVDLTGSTAWQRTWSAGDIDRATHVLALKDGLAIAGWGRVQGRGDEALLWRTDLWGNVSCNEAAGCSVPKPSKCIDNNPCTADVCGSQGCDHPILPDGLPCGDKKVCISGSCS